MMMRWPEIEASRDCCKWLLRKGLVGCRSDFATLELRPDSIYGSSFAREPTGVKPGKLMPPCTSVLLLDRRGIWRWYRSCWRR
jgi:hypothetical protein